MTKITKKTDNINAVFFDKSNNPSEWPQNVVANIKSPTGYSYGSLNQKSTKMGTGYPAIDGFVVPDKSWILVDGTGKAWIETDDEFNEKYSF